MRLTSRLHLVGSAAGGLAFTDPYDAHVYLIDGGSEAALVDAGLGRAPDALLDHVRACGVAPDRLTHVLITHAHPDHAGGAAALLDRLPGLRIAASPEVAQFIREGDEDAMSLEIGKRSDFYPPDYRFRASPVDVELHDGDRLRIGAVEVRVLETPGHSAGHLSFVAKPDGETVLFSGDLLFYGGRISLLNTWDCSIQRYAASIGTLRGLGAHALLPGHQALSLRWAQRHIDTANRLLDHGFVPPSLV